MVIDFFLNSNYPSLPFQSHASQQPLADSNQSPASGNSTGAANSSGNQAKGRPKKRKASSSNNNNNNSETGQSNKKLVKSNSKQTASTSSGNITGTLFFLNLNGNKTRRSCFCWNTLFNVLIYVDFSFKNEIRLI